MSSEEEFLAGLGDQQADAKVEDDQPKVDEQDNDQEQGGEAELELSPIEQKAYDQGWRPQEDFTGPEDHWKTAKEYVKDGEWLAKIKEANQRTERLERDFNERLENTNKLNEVRRVTEIAELKKQQREAVEMADGEAYDKTQRQIEVLEGAAVTTNNAQPPAKDQDIVAWEEQNAWINDVNDERTAIAQALFTNYANQHKNATAKEALEHVDSKIGKLYPSSNANPRREQPNTTETGRKAPQRKNRELTMADLTQDEQRDYNLFGQSMFKTEKAYLKAVKDARVK